MEKVQEVERGELLALLKQWQTGAIDEREAHERAETLMDEIGELPSHPESDPRSIASEVLLQLDVLNHQLITPEDIPAIQGFLETPPGEELQGWAAWRSYWEQLDLENRRRILEKNPYYST